MEGRDEEAEELYDEGLPLAQEIDRVAWICDALDGKAHLALHRGDAAGAARLFRESLVIAREGRDAGHVAESIHGLAAVAASEGDYARAARMSGAAEALFTRTALVSAPYPSLTERYLIPGRGAPAEKNGTKPIESDGGCPRTKRLHMPSQNHPLEPRFSVRSDLHSCGQSACREEFVWLVGSS